MTQKISPAAEPHRTSSVHRLTAESDITARVNLDGSGVSEIDTGIAFFDHMLAQLSFYALVDITLRAKGDLGTGSHHTVEDVGIVLGEAIAQALGERKGIVRFAEALTPMDDVLVQVALDLSNRAFLHYDLPLQREHIGTLEVETVKEFYQALAQRLGCALHITALHTGNEHHLIEASFKGVGRALRVALAPDPRRKATVSSTKGVL